MKKQITTTIDHSLTSLVLTHERREEEEKASELSDEWVFFFMTDLPLLV